MGSKPGAGGDGLGEVAGNLLSVLFGDGGGHFQAGPVYRGEPSMYGLAVGDLNVDGFPDVVTANQGSNTASVFINDGKGGFGDPQGEVIGTSNSATSRFLFADIDGNGTQDILLLELPPFAPGSMQITAMLNDGSGKFSQPIRSPAWQENQFSPQDFALGDFRNTGRPDLVVVGDSTLYFAPNIGGGSFGTGTVGAVAGASGLVAVGDFDGDGKLDFVTLSGTLNIFLGNGDGTFRVGQSIFFEDVGVVNGNDTAVYVGDFNRDGKLDILALTDGLYEFLGNGDGTFQPGRRLLTSFGGNEETRAFVLADVNRDGWQDLIAMTDQFGDPANFIPTVSIFLGQPDGTFQYSQTYSPYLDYLQWPVLLGTALPGEPFPFAAVVGDFNGDGNPDVAMFQAPSQVAQSEAFVQVLFENGDGTFTPSYLSYPWNKSYVPQFALDVNGDGLADLIELDSYTSSFTIVKSVPNALNIQIEMLSEPINSATGFGRAVLNAPAATPTTVILTATDPNIMLPLVTIPTGSVQQDFQFSIGSGFNSHNVVAIQGQVGSSTATAYAYTLGTPQSFALELEPTALQFGDVNVAATSSPQSVTVKNLGSAPMTLSVRASLWYAETDDCSGALAPGASCNLEVTFTSPFPGLAPGGLNFSPISSTADEQVSLEGFGVGLQLGPCCLAFTVPVGTASAPQTLTVTNQETSTLQIAVANPSPSGQFTQSNNCGTLAPGASCQIIATFQPTSAGYSGSNVLVTDNLSSNNQVTASLEGTASDFSLNPNQGSATVTAGQSATYQLTLQSLYGFSGNVILSCSGAPSTGACSLSSNSVNVDANQSPNVTLTVTTTAKSTSSLVSSRSINFNQYENVWWSLSLTIVVVSVVCHRRRHNWLLKATALFLLVPIYSCGGGSGPSGGGGGGTGGGGGAGGGGSGTPAGTYTITVAAVSEAISHSFSLTLTVD